MDLLNNLALGFGTALTLQNLFFCFAGTLLGTAVGVLPGIGPLATIAMLLPITFNLPAETALIMLAGIYYGAQYGSSTTAILLNMPGEASSVVTAIDGYQMARNGQAGTALATAALSSFFAGTVGTFVVVLAAPILTEAALSFGPAEYFSLLLLGLIGSIALARGSVMKALAMIIIGLLLGLTGVDIYTGVSRFTMGFIELDDGVSVAALALGIFGVAEVLRNLELGVSHAGAMRSISGLMPTRDAIKAAAAPTVRGTVLGSMLGVLPGGGPILASFVSYSLEKRFSRNRDRIGHGAIEGVAAPEAANNAGAQTSFIPMLTLGLPSNPLMALMIGAFIIQGIVPGPSIATQQPTLFWGLIVSMWVGNFMLVLLNLPLIGLWVRLLTIPYGVLFPAILVFASIGIVSIDGTTFDLFFMAIFGIIGYALFKLDCEPAPLLLGFVLGPMLEEHLRRAMLLSRGDPMIFIERPISAVLLFCALGAFVVMALPMISRKRSELFVED